MYGGCRGKRWRRLEAASIDALGGDNVLEVDWARATTVDIWEIKDLSLGGGEHLTNVQLLEGAEQYEEHRAEYTR